MSDVNLTKVTENYKPDVKLYFIDFGLIYIDEHHDEESKKKEFINGTP